MKLKYKKAILLSMMSTMGIGLLILSISHDNTKMKASLNKNISKEANLVIAWNSDLNENSLEAEEYDVQALSTSIPTPLPSPPVASSQSPIPSITPSQTPLPVYDIEEDGYPEIDALFQDYYAAKNNCDIEKIKSLLSNPSDVISIERLQKETEYIDDYRNIKCYTKKALEEGTYIVYVYYETKFITINTTAPELKHFYLITDGEGKLKIYSGDLGKEMEEYCNARNEDADVQELIQMTNKKCEEAKDKDEDLRNYWKS